MDAEAMRHHARLLKAIAHPTRLIILTELMKAEKCVNDIQDLLTIPQPNVSQHLALLKDTGLVASRKDGVRRCYHLVKPALIRELFALLGRHRTGTGAADPRASTGGDREPLPSQAGQPSP